mgnify:CR=1 FL=1
MTENCPRRSVHPEKAVFQDTAESGDTVFPVDLLALLIGSSRVGDGHLIHPASLTGQFDGHFRFEAEPFFPERDLFQILAAEHLVTALHIVQGQVRQHIAELLTRQDVQNLVNNLKETNPSLVDELIPKLLGLGEVQKVLQNLLKEGISIRDLLTIFETLADYAPSTRDTDILTEYVRQSLKRAISNKFFPPNETTSVVTLDPKIEQEIMASVKQTENGAYLTLDPERTKAIIKSVETEIAKLENLGKNPIIITSPIVRMYFKRLTEDYVKDLIVVSYNEVENNVELQSVGMVTA